MQPSFAMLTQGATAERKRNVVEFGADVREKSLGLARARVAHS